MNDRFKHLLLILVLIAMPNIGFCQLKNVTDVYSVKIIDCNADICNLEVEYSYDLSKGKDITIGTLAYSNNSNDISTGLNQFKIELGNKNKIQTTALRPSRVTAFTTNMVNVSLNDKNRTPFFNKFINLTIEWPAISEPKTGDIESRRDYNEKLLYAAISIIDGIDNYADDQLKVAKKYLEKIIFNDPKYTQAYIELARVAMKSDTNITEQGKSQGASEAERILKTALTIDPNYANTYVLYGYVMAIQNRTDEALASFKRAQQIGTNNLWLYANWGLAYKNAKQFDEAIRVYSQGLINIPDPTTPLLRSNARALPVIFNNLEALYEQKEDWQSLDSLLFKKVAITHKICVNVDHARVRLLYFSDIEQAMKMATIAYDNDCNNARDILAATYFSQWALDRKLTDASTREQIYRKGQALTDNMQNLINILASSDFTAPVLSQLKTSGIDIDAIDSKDLTPLAYAAIVSELDVMKRLIKLGADPNRKLNELGLTPLIVAVVSGQVDAVSVLIASGADPKTKAVDGTTAVMLAKQMGRNDIVDVLQRKNQTL